MLLGVVLPAMAVTADTHPAQLVQPGTWLYTQPGSGYGVKDVGLLVHDFQGNLIVLARAPLLRNLSNDYELPLPGAFASQDWLLAKFDPRKRLLCVRKVGEEGFPHISRLVASRTGHIYAVGTFRKPARVLNRDSEYRFSCEGASDFMVLKWTPDGELLYALQYGGEESESASGIVLAESGNLAVTGHFTGLFDVEGVSGTVRLQRKKPGHGIFLLNLDPSGRGLWGRTFDGEETPGASLPPAVGVDRPGNLFVTGGFESHLGVQGSPALTSDSRGGRDIFLAKFSPGGDALWIRTAGGPADDYATRVLLDDTGCSHVVGRFGSAARFGDGPAAVELEALGRADMFMACYHSDGTLLGAIRVGGQGPTVDPHWIIVLDELGNRYLLTRSEQPALVWQTPRPSTLAVSSSLRASPPAEVQNPPSRFQSIALQSDGAIGIVIDGNWAGIYIVDASVDLTNWTPISTNQVHSGSITIVDPEATFLPMRFYRIRQPFLPR